MYNKNKSTMYTEILKFFPVFLNYTPEDWKNLTFALIKPDFHHRSEEMMSDITNKFGFQIVFAASYNVKPIAKELYAEHNASHNGGTCRPFFPGLVKTMSSGPSKILLLHHEPVKQVIAKELVIKLCYELWRDVIGPKNPREGSMDTLRHNYYFQEHGTDYSFYDSGDGTNGFHGSDGLLAAALEAMKVLCAMYREADHTQLAEGVKGLIEANTSTVHLID
jgi:nucleoside diphosphate kinase